MEFIFIFWYQIYQNCHLFIMIMSFFVNILNYKAQ